jgi:hypothetical protein
MNKIVEISCDIREVNMFPNNYVSKISGDNLILAKIVNTVLQSGDIPIEFKNKIISSCGEDCFKKMIEDGTYIWRGL